LYTTTLAAAMAAHTLCRSCVHLRITYGKLGQEYLLCRSDAVPVKYPPQPVLRCPAYAPLPPPAAGAAPGPGIVPGEPL
jgi:hypothetical protein